MEQWKPVVGYEGIYTVSDLGRVKRVLGGRHGARLGRILKFRLDAHGYCRTLLRHNYTSKGVQVHRLVLEAFSGPPPRPGMHCNHINGVRTDNRPDNLEWVTPQGNVDHAIEVLGKHSCGSKHSKAKLTETQVAEYLFNVDRQPVGYSRRMAKEWGVSEMTLSCIRNGRSWTAITGKRAIRPNSRQRKIDAGRPRLEASAEARQYAIGCFR